MSLGRLFPLFRRAHVEASESVLLYEVTLIPSGYCTGIGWLGLTSILSFSPSLTFSLPSSSSWQGMRTQERFRRGRESAGYQEKLMIIQGGPRAGQESSERPTLAGSPSI
jgi:hypothetical protein